jgi:2-isopropylmalate synthase
MSITHPSFGKLDDDRIIIFDTTLRDGEQSPGFSMNLKEKLRMAEALAELGVDAAPLGGAAFDAFIRAEMDRLGKLVRQSGAKLD